jgi:hypothetical protein
MFATSAATEPNTAPRPTRCCAAVAVLDPVGVNVLIVAPQMSAWFVAAVSATTFDEMTFERARR